MVGEMCSPQKVDRKWLITATPDWRWENSSTQANRPSLHISLPGTLSFRAESQNLSSHERASKITFLRKKKKVRSCFWDSKQLTLLYLTAYVQIKKAVNSAGSYMCHSNPTKPHSKDSIPWHSSLTGHSQQRYNYPGMAVLWLDACRSLSFHCGWKNKRKDELCRILLQSNIFLIVHSKTHTSELWHWSHWASTALLGLLRGAAGECGAQVQTSE